MDPFLMNYPSSQAELEMSDDNRKHARYRGKEGAFAAFLRPNELVNLGQIVDISMGGLCVRYLSTNELDQDNAEIKIFGSNGRFIHVDRVQCKVVYDLELPDGTWNQLSMRRCGVEFQKLTVRHVTLIQDFIEHFSEGTNL
jgi:hypothetical protein